MTGSGWSLVSVERGAARLFAVIACLAGAATLTGFFGRLGWLVELTAHFRVQYLWLLAASAVALAICKKAKLAAAGAALAVVNLAVIAPLYLGTGSPPATRPITRVMSLNVHWKNRDYARTLRWLRAAKPDIVLLLEVTPAWAKALGELEAEFPYSMCVPRKDSGGVGLYSRFPLTDLIVQHRAEIGMSTIIAQVQLANRRLTVIGAHPASPSSFQHFDDRNRQLAALGRLARQQTGPTVVVGDLNVTSWSPYFQDLLDESGLSDTRRGFGVQGSWPALPLPLRIPIDHCLISVGIGVHDRRIGPAVGSDHRGVIVDLTVGEP